MFRIKFYRTSGGSAPVKEWLDTLENGNIDEVDLLDVIRNKINLLIEKSNNFERLGKQHVHCLTRGEKIDCHIWELIVKNYRIFYSQYSNIYVLLHFVHKKTNKVDRNDINISITRMKEWVYKNGRNI